MDSIKLKVKDLFNELVTDSDYEMDGEFSCNDSISRCYAKFLKIDKHNRVYEL